MGGIKMSHIFNNTTLPPVHDYLFNWGVDYSNNTSQTEFDQNTRQKNDFYSIQQDRILRFGLFGQNMKFFYESDGAFNLNGRRIEIEYHLSDDSKIYNLTTNFSQKDCITYKQAHSNYSPNVEHQKAQIDSINFGYKTLIELEDGLQFYFQPVVSLPMNDNVNIEVKLTSNKELDGKIVFKSKGEIKDVFDNPLKRNYANITTWIVK